MGAIKSAYDAGEKMGATHMIVAWDSFDDSNYPIYVMPGENPRNKTPKNGDSVDECYRYSLGWEYQAEERRARHFEYEELPEMEKEILPGETATLHTNVYLSNGVLLPYTLPELEAIGRPAESGEAFITLSDLEEFRETRSFDSHMNFDERAGKALVDAGWATMTTGHSYVASEEFRSGEILRAVYDRMEALWEEQKNKRALAIYHALSEKERADLKTILIEGPQQVDPLANETE
jgi:hypothetical protein